MRYTKQAIPLSEQIRTLRERGLIFDDEALAEQKLGFISYFRLADYWRPMELDEHTHQFLPHSTFQDVISRYQFDKELKSLLFSAIQTIEIAVRSKIIQHFSAAHGAFWFMESSLFIDGALFNKHILRLRQEVARSQESFIRQHFRKYDSPDLPPVWKTLEVVSLGTLSKLFSNFSDKDAKDFVAADFRLPQHIVLESWLESLTSLRNFIAHHARIWNRRFPQKPELLRRSRYPWIANRPQQPFKLYPILCCITYWLNAIDASNTFATDFKKLLMKYPNVDVRMMGFPREWENEPLWK
ncbi:MAG: Abi family protein [Bacteroidaceae bacterium]|nr:Abi family protein [Bacteroidaceae bacterium]